MRRWTDSKALYRGAARSVWHRYRPSLLDFSVGIALIRDRTVCRWLKLRSLLAATLIFAGLFLVPLALAWGAHVPGPAAAPVLTGLAAAASILLFAPLALVRLSDPAQVVRVRLQRQPIIPLRKR